jgi:hypothetical protein
VWGPDKNGGGGMNEQMIEQCVNISGGNPGALSVLVQLGESPELINYLFENGPKGSGLWILYKDSCGEDIELLAAELLRRWYAADPEDFDAMAERLRAEVGV